MKSLLLIASALSVGALFGCSGFGSAGATSAGGMSEAGQQNSLELQRSPDRPYFYDPQTGIPATDSTR